MNQEEITKSVGQLKEGTELLRKEFNQYQEGFRKSLLISMAMLFSLIGNLMILVIALIAPGWLTPIIGILCLTLILLLWSKVRHNV